MFELALRAGIPLVSARTSDTVHLVEVLSFWAGAKVQKHSGLTKSVSPNTIYYTMSDPSGVELLYSQLIEQDSVLVLVNLEEGEALRYAFDAGEIPTPVELIEEHLNEVIQGDLKSLLPSLKGLTIKQALEVVRLTSAAHGQLTARTIQHMRQALTGRVTGLQEVAATLDIYRPVEELEAWVKLNKAFFTKPQAFADLIPRGVLFNGPPGVGKTQGAKYIAREWDVPLFRLNFGASLNKYVGESESNFNRILQSVDQEEPCVLLIDEVEKLFTEKEDSGVTARLLGQLLWWLQEHKSRVLTVMTTNDINRLPPELYRPGRIDTVLSIEKLEGKAALELAAVIMKKFVASPTKAQMGRVKEELTRLIQADLHKRLAHVEVVQAVHDVVKSLFSKE